jgi:hypothetical protein
MIVNRFRAAATQAGADIGPILKFAKGHYSVGDDEIAIGTEYVAHVSDTACGWVKFCDKKVVKQRIGRVADGFTMPLREELDDNNPDTWERDAGRPRDPWASQWYLPLVNVETGRVVFASGSGGGRKAIGRLMRAFADSPHCGNPTIKLDTRSYKHPTYGRIDEPLFIIIGWEKSPTVAEEMDDEIPFS